MTRDTEKVPTPVSTIGGCLSPEYAPILAMTSAADLPEDGSPADSSAPTPAPSSGRRVSLGEELITELAATMPRSSVTHIRHEPPRHSVTAPWPDWAHPELVSHLAEQGLTSLWAHQARTAEYAHAGEDVIVSTGTASGKSLGYQLPILSELTHVGNTATALYLSPTKALAQDQRTAIAQMCAGVDALKDVMVATYDGDTPAEARRVIREQARIVVTNPCLLYTSDAADEVRRV